MNIIKLTKHVLRDHRFPALAILFLFMFIFTVRVAYAPSNLYSLEDRFIPPCALTTSGCIEGSLAQKEDTTAALFDVEIKAVARQLYQRETIIPIIVVAVVFLTIAAYSVYYKRRKRNYSHLN